MLVHRQRKRANDTPMQSVRPLQELDAVDPRQSDIGRDERHVEVSLQRTLGDRR